VIGSFGEMNGSFAQLVISFITPQSDSEGYIRVEEAMSSTSEAKYTTWRTQNEHGGSASKKLKYNICHNDPQIDNNEPK
jgi:hypothetical protein